jgi:hypothetical protein
VAFRTLDQESGAYSFDVEFAAAGHQDVSASQTTSSNERFESSSHTVITRASKLRSIEVSREKRKDRPGEVDARPTSASPALPSGCDPRACDSDRQRNGDCAPAELEMEATTTHGNQQRLGEKERIPCRDGEAVDQVEAGHGRVERAAVTRRAVGHEMPETHQHGHQKDGTRGAVEPTISFHFAPLRGLLWDVLNWRTRGRIPYKGLAEARHSCRNAALQDVFSSLYCSSESITAKPERTELLLGCRQYGGCQLKSHLSSGFYLDQ